MSVNSSEDDPRSILLLVGEGPHDVGREDDPGGALAGFLTAILEGPGESLAEHELPFAARIRLWKDLVLQPSVKKKPRFADVTKLPLDARRVQAAMLVASILGCDGAVVLRDCETVENLHLGETLRQGRDEATEPFPTAIGTASRCHETWLLADRNAVREILGEKGIYLFSKSPEERPHCDDLKKHIDEHSERLRLHSSEIRSGLAFRASPEVLAKQCPKCYPDFRDDVETHIRPLLGERDDES